MHILILRPGAVGDTLLTFPILQHLHKKYHQAEITFVGNASVLPLAKAFGLAQTIADYEEPQWGQFFVPLRNPLSKKASRLQEITRQMDMAIFWLRDPGTTLTHNAHAMGIKQIIVAPGRPTEDMHIVTYLGQSIDTAWQIPEQYAWNTASSALTKPRTIAIHPGSGGAQKCWPIAYFTALIEQLWQHEIPILLLAGPADHERIAELYRKLPAPPQITLLHTFINTPLLAVAQQIRECRGYIGNDSGITHLAALLGLPTLAIFGPSNPKIWRPIGPHVNVFHEPLLTQLSVDAVLTHALSFPT
jgi:ADP-heptose:LPS heptosyltransferase